MYLDSIHFQEKIYEKTNEIWVTQNSAIMKKNVSFIIACIEYAIVYYYQVCIVYIRCTHAMQYEWRSKDHFLNLMLAFLLYVCSGDGRQAASVHGNTFTIAPSGGQYAILLIPNMLMMGQLHDHLSLFQDSNT